MENKTLYTLDDLNKQKQQCLKDVEKLVFEISEKTRSLTQTRGILSYVEYLLAHYKFPEERNEKKPEEPITPPADPVQGDLNEIH